MEIWFKIMERSWRSTGQDVYEPCSLVMNWVHNITRRRTQLRECLRLREWLPLPAPREQQQPIRLTNSGAAQRWLALTTERSVSPLPLAPLWFLLRRSALNSTFLILRDLLSAVIIARQNESTMKFVANYINNRFLSIRCCSPTDNLSLVTAPPFSSPTLSGRRCFRGKRTKHLCGRGFDIIRLAFVYAERGAKGLRHRSARLVDVSQEAVVQFIVLNQNGWILKSRKLWFWLRFKPGTAYCARLSDNCHWLI